MPKLKKLLILDPSPVFRRTLKNAVQAGFPDVEILGAHTTDRAEDILKREQPDVVLLDIAVPPDNGLEFIVVIRRTVPQARIIVLTDYDSPEYQQTSLQKGADYFLSKEYSGGSYTLGVISDAIGT